MPKIHPDGTPKEPEKLGSPQGEPQPDAQPQAENDDQHEAELAITRVVEEQTPESPN